MSETLQVMTAFADQCPGTKRPEDSVAYIRDAVLFLTTDNDVYSEALQWRQSDTTANYPDSWPSIDQLRAVGNQVKAGNIIQLAAAMSYYEELLGAIILKPHMIPDTATMMGVTDDVLLSFLAAIKANNSNAQATVLYLSTYDETYE